ncbi:hypothetical protein [Bradyrhizobium symbiodeficiens]|uniref:hypothetical protein n=1 Tax=Bradyrhizobium symbiodeficiens TaxID=1404367 RepID=UPI00140F5E4A|nr:hypothetical protein [Bradyrhizobium symbiodeficiens]QIO98834.1 hypothetical protein HAU86_02990 [Bradyrhizobium symbiodeficiens]
MDKLPGSPLTKTNFQDRDEKLEPTDTQITSALWTDRDASPSLVQPRWLVARRTARPLCTGLFGHPVVQSAFQKLRIFTRSRLERARLKGSASAWRLNARITREVVGFREHRFNTGGLRHTHDLRFNGAVIDHLIRELRGLECHEVITFALSVASLRDFELLEQFNEVCEGLPW